ncbi:MAG: hypothetical protein CMJ18_16495 [Phycisphaeraceae bacterium]|nr:hypothetical protein [Phycisphaeraceae bacterium]
MSGPDQTYPCTSCQRRLRWRPDLVGRRVRCPCGAVIVVPDAVTEPVADEDGATDADGSGVREAAAAAGVFGQMGGRSAMERRLERREDEDLGSKAMDVHVPLAFLIVGVIINFALWLIFVDGVGLALLGGLGTVLGEALIFAPLTIFVAFYTASLIDTDFGPLRQATFKLSAIAIGPGAVADCLFFSFMSLATFDFWILPIGFLIFVIVVGSPLALMYRLGLHETALFVAILVLPRIAALFGLGAVFKDLFFSGM